MPASFEARLIPHRSTWDVIRLTWAPFVVALLVVIVAELIEPVSAAASDAIGVLASLCFVGGVFYIPFMWQRGPAITVADGALRVGATQAPLAGLAATRGEYVYCAASRVAAGTYWMPMLRLRLADGHELRIACQGAGGRAEGRTRTDVTIGDLLAHTAGLWSSAAEWNDWVGPNLGALRGYTRESDYAAEDAALRARYPEFAADLERTRTWLAANRSLPGPVYFPSRYDVRLEDPQLESLGVILTRCLARDPAGTTDWEPNNGSYSNTDFTMLSQVVSHLGAGGRYAAETGHPDTHEGSHLDVFLAQHGIDGGVETPEGIFNRPSALGTVGWHPPMPALDGDDLVLLGRDGQIDRTPLAAPG